MERSNVRGRPYLPIELSVLCPALSLGKLYFWGGLAFLRGLIVLLCPVSGAVAESRETTYISKRFPIVVPCIGDGACLRGHWCSIL